MKKKLLLLVALVSMAVVNAPAMADAAALATDAAATMSAASGAVETYAKAILAVLVVMAGATILFGLTHKAR